MDEVHDVLGAEVARSVDEATAGGRLGFSVQAICATAGRCEVLYGECLARLRRPDGELCEAACAVRCCQVVARADAHA